MSFQSSATIDTDTFTIEKPKNDCEKHLINCLKAPEWELRRWLKKVLTRAGFEIYEDGYKSDRCDKEKRYESVHNMIAVRGNTGKVCLVAHTDICRDHTETRQGEGKVFHGEMYYSSYDRHGEDTSKPKVPR